MTNVTYELVTLVTKKKLRWSQPSWSNKNYKIEILRLFYITYIANKEITQLRSFRLKITRIIKKNSSFCDQRNIQNIRQKKIILYTYLIFFQAMTVDLSS